MLVQIPFKNQLFPLRMFAWLRLPKPADAQLMASILADGILQNLVVINTEAGDDTFEVIAGGRRLAAGPDTLKRVNSL